MPPPPVSSISPDTSGSLNWWQSVLLAALSALFGVIAVVMAQSSSGANAPKPQVLFRYVPHFLLMFGVLADAFTYQGVYWTSTVAGIAGYFGGGVLDTILNGIASMLGKIRTRAGGAPAPSAPVGMPITQDGTYDGCTFQGGSVETLAVPPTLSASSSVMWYFIIDSIDNHGATSAIGSIVAFMGLYGAQVSSITKCITNLGSGAGWGLVYGLVIAGIFYAIMKSFAPNYLPSSVVNAGGSGGFSGIGTGSSSTSVASTAGTGAQPTACPK